MEDAIQPAQVLAPWGFTADTVVEPMAGGLINKTWLLTQGSRRGVLQKVNAIFGPKVHLDIEAITAHLQQHGMVTPRLLRTTSGALWHTAADGSVWRVLSFLNGRTVEKVPGPAVARAAGGLVARFHRVIASLEHSFNFSRPGAHDTPLHLAKLQRAVEEKQDHPNFSAVLPVATGILEDAATLERFPLLPTRIIHGDLKISNLLFDPAMTTAVALLDLDTMAHSTIPVELGDALRSWCNPRGEDADGIFDRAIYEAAIQGYAQEGSGFLTREEVDSVVLGARTISLELAARFCADALYETYFGWNASQFPSRSEHNRVRARGQLMVSRSVAAQRAALEAVTRQAFSNAAAAP